MSQKLIEIHGKISKLEYQKEEAMTSINTLIESYRKELVYECVDGLFKILTDEDLTKRDMEIYIRNLSIDVRDLYKNL